MIIPIKPHHFRFRIYKFDLTEMQHHKMISVKHFMAINGWVLFSLVLDIFCNCLYEPICWGVYWTPHIGLQFGVIINMTIQWVFLMYAHHQPVFVLEKETMLKWICLDERVDSDFSQDNWQETSRLKSVHSSALIKDILILRHNVEFPNPNIKEIHIKI